MIVKARSFLTSDGLDITRLSGRPRTLGNVGVALSGGSSRSALASMGAIRALHHFNLLRHVRAISCVSGGAWFSVPFSFLPARFDEETFLGPYVEDPGSLRLDDEDAPTSLRTLRPGHFGAVLSDFEMSSAGFVVELLRAKHEGVSNSRLWAREVAQLLEPFELARFEGLLPADSFVGDRAMALSMSMSAPDLPSPYIVRESQLMPRPALIVGGAMLVQGPEGEDRLAPVQFTPWYSGVMGKDIGTLEGRSVGGGGVSSYAFGGEWLGGSAERPRVQLQAPLTLTDITSITSAYFADALNDRGMTELSPDYHYFSPHWRPGKGVRALFADGGSLENTGVANLLAYRDVDKVIALVNAPEEVELEGGELVLDAQIAALFGYQKFERGRGYLPYGEPGPGPSDVARNQVFSDARGEFAQLREAFAERLAAGEAIVALQQLELVDNPVFAVEGGREVEVLWVVLSPSERWCEQLHPLVRLSLPPKFPNVSSARTAFASHVVSLLGHFTAWSLAQHRQELGQLFSD